ncbi:uncharacterized protein LOC134254821 [Saccostrea cucullata]|uniref:uncharacterized protein LOC134254821 n=1 Tax=Saccostrea cuccullata TaxID=36930 RepID=UPI002ED50676
MWRTFGIFAGICAISEIVYQFYTYRFMRSIREEGKSTEVLFFPDKKVACIKHFTSECESESCSYSHEENSLSKLFKYLHEAVYSLDVCVFVITCTDLADLLIQAAGRGVCVRVITDCEQVDIPGSQIWKLRSQGIAVRTDDSSFFMHHKFVIIDNKKLLNGSFNWTRQAITGNQENLLVTSEPKVLHQYKERFSFLWRQYNPKKEK